DETISSVQSISNQAQINAGTAIDNALEAMQQASQAVENTGSLKIREDEVENTLSVKADKQTVDDLTGVVDLQALDIKANADGLKLKANQDTVDMLEGTVSSLGTEVNAVAGQISNKVWKTDIETAIDGIEVGGRNLLIGTSEEELEVQTPSFAIGSWNPGLTIGEEYTFSFDIKSENATYLQNVFLNNSNTGFVPKHPISTEWTRVQFTFEWKGGTYNGVELRPHVYPRPNYLGTYVSRIKLEKGNKATDWTPAPEDTDAKIEHIETEWT